MVNCLSLGLQSRSRVSPNTWSSDPGTFLRNHAPDIAAMDLFVVPTIGFDLLYAFVIVRLGRRDLVSLSETQTRTYWWCSPPKSGTGITRPALWTAREIGASFCSDRCVRTSL